MRLCDIPDGQLNELVSIHIKLSPEALTADGELPPEVWRPRQVELERRLLELQKELGLSQDDVDECACYRESDRRLDQRRRGLRRMP